AVLNGLRRTGLCACRLFAGFEPVVTERAFAHRAIVLLFADHAEGTRDHAVSAAVADVVLDNHRTELGTDDRARRAHVETARVRAVLAHVRFHQPAAVFAVVA